jgi:hypothetical protein
MEDLDILLTEQDEAYGKALCDRNFSYLSQYNESFLNQSVRKKKDFLIKGKQKQGSIVSRKKP